MADVVKQRLSASGGTGRLCADGVQASPYGVGAVLGSTASKAAWQSPNADRDAGAAAEGCDCMSREERWSGVFGSWPTAVRHWCAKSRCPGGVRWGLLEHKTAGQSVAHDRDLHAFLP